MTIMESAIAMNNDYIDCTNTIGKVELFAEASYKEYEINLKEVALKVLKENGTEEDFDFLATEAANGYIERAKKAIEKIIEAVRKFIASCKEKLIKLVTNETTRMAIEKVDDACASNPKLRTKKVEYQNTDRQVGALQQGIDSVRKRVAKVKAKGRASESDIDALEEIEETTMKKVAAISVVTVATLGTALAVYKECNSRSEIEDILNENALSDCEIMINENNTKNAETAAFYTRSAGLIAKLKKEKATKKIVKSTSLLAAIKKAISKSTVSENLEEQVSESVLEDLVMFTYVTESVDEVVEHNNDESESETIKTESVGVSEGLDLDNYFDTLCDELFTNVTTESTSESIDDIEIVDLNNEQVDVVEESAEDTVPENVTEDTVTESETEETPLAEVYLEQLESEVFGQDNDTVTTESSTEETDDTTENIQTESTEDTVEEVTTEMTVASLLDEMEALL